MLWERRVARTKDEVVDETMAAMTKLKEGSPYALFIVAVNTVIRLIQNVLEHPTESKYGRIRFNNSAILPLRI